jgi:peptidylprolyl isomerase domain and WD repeat-containing protein 1
LSGKLLTLRQDWLDGKHTIFGRVIAGFDNVHTIEKARTHKEKPIDKIEILSIDVE